MNVVLGYLLNLFASMAAFYVGKYLGHDAGSAVQGALPPVLAAIVSVAGSRMLHVATPPIPKTPDNDVGNP